MVCVYHTERMLSIMTISLFSGQGSQYEGMGKDIAEAMPELAEVYETGSAVLGIDLKDICFNAPLDELSRTINSQPAIMATSIVCLKAAQAKGNQVLVMMHHMTDDSSIRRHRLEDDQTTFPLSSCSTADLRHHHKCMFVGTKIRLVQQWVSV